MVCVIVEDCLENLDNCFELVLVFSWCVCQLQIGGKELCVVWENDKFIVVVLCEIVVGEVIFELVENLIVDQGVDVDDLVMLIQLFGE